MRHEKWHRFQASSCIFFENSAIALDWEVGTNHGATQGATGATGATVWRRKEKEEEKKNRKSIKGKGKEHNKIK